MKIGIVFPQTEFGNGAAALRDYGQAIEGLGFTHLLAFDHVLGVKPANPKEWKGAYTYADPFHEPFVLFSFLAAVTRKLEFTTGVIILPQRQTALVAKQAAALDTLSVGRLRLGVGLGWNEAEYVALGQDFHTRGRRFEEQVEVLRLLWTRPVVAYQGRWHTLQDVGLNPLPVQQPIPLWFGGHADPVLRRAARLADGWMPNSRTPADARPLLDKLRQYLAEAGRSSAGFGFEARIPYGEGRPKDWQALAQGWEALGATHLSFNSMRAGLNGPGPHLEAARVFAKAVGVG